MDEFEPLTTLCVMIKDVTPMIALDISKVDCFDASILWIDLISLIL